MKTALKALKFLSFCGLLALVTALGSCTAARVIMQQSPKNAPKFTHVPLSVNAGDLGNDKQALQDIMFGQIPKFTTAEITQSKGFGPVLGGIALMDEWTVRAGFGAKEGQFRIVILRPVDDPKAPLILTQNFCPNHAVVPIEGLSKPEKPFFDCSSDGFVSGIFGFFFGRYITTPPLEDIISTGYGFAAIYPSEFVPDNAPRGLAVIEALFPDTPAQDRPGALAIWSAQSIWLADKLKSDMDVRKVVTYGHSRFGKTALISAAFSKNIDAVIAHQSGTGGASVVRDDVGESIGAITESYPQWFSPHLKAYGDNPSALPVDAQHLLALIAPRPILLGNARRDVWSDPNGAFLAAQQADKIWEGYGLEGLNQEGLNDFNPDAEIAFWQRPGTHGIVKEDWPAFLAFMDAHFQKP